MNLLEKINECSINELTQVIDEAIENAINNAEEKEGLGFINGKSSLSKLEPHKGFILPNTKIKYSTYSMNLYSMKTKDYFYEFALYLKENNIKDKGNLVKCLENFIIDYFGIPNEIDKRDDVFDELAFQTTTTDEEYFEKLDYLEIGDLKGKNVAMCTERGAIAQNLLSLFGFEIYYCIGCVNNNGKEEAHCFNIARVRDTYILLDYSMPVPVVENNEVVDWAPFQGIIEISEIEDVLNGINKSFIYYEYIKTPNGIQKKYYDDMRTYNVGHTNLVDALTPDETQKRKG